MSFLKSIGDIMFDVKTRIINVLDNEISELHQGHRFVAHHKFPAVGSGAKAILYMKTPAEGGPEYHTVINFSTEGESEIQVRESATVSLSGTVMSTYNRDRNSELTSDAEVRSSATVVTSGTLLSQAQVGGGSISTAFGGKGASRDEIILKYSTVYLFQVVSEAAANDIIIGVDWYEHTPLD